MTTRTRRSLLAVRASSVALALGVAAWCHQATALPVTYAFTSSGGYLTDPNLGPMRVDVAGAVIVTTPDFIATSLASSCAPGSAVTFCTVTFANDQTLLFNTGAVLGEGDLVTLSLFRPDFGQQGAGYLFPLNAFDTPGTYSAGSVRSGGFATLTVSVADPGPANVPEPATLLLLLAVGLAGLGLRRQPRH